MRLSTVIQPCPVIVPTLPAATYHTLGRPAADSLLLGAPVAGSLSVRALHTLGRPDLDLLLFGGLAAGLLSVRALLLVRLDSAYTYCGMEGGRRAKIRARSPRTVSCPPAPLHSLAVLGGAGSPYFDACAASAHSSSPWLESAPQDAVRRSWRGAGWWSQQDHPISRCEQKKTSSPRSDRSLVPNPSSTSSRRQFPRDDKEPR